jgi:hypothetical protein
VSVADDIAAAFKSATRDLAKEKKQRERDAARARRHAAARWSERQTTLKEAAFEVLDRAVAKATGNGAYMVSARTLYYQVRPLIQERTDKPLEYGYFSQTLLTEYRDAYGPVDGLYYDPRGALREPHSGAVVNLGTREVAGYQVPEWTFDKILYVEKKAWSRSSTAPGSPSATTWRSPTGRAMRSKPAGSCSLAPRPATTRSWSCTTPTPTATRSPALLAKPLDACPTTRSRS